MPHVVILTSKYQQFSQFLHICGRYIQKISLCLPGSWSFNMEGSAESIISNN
jgi:hypothetical protein